MKYYKKVKVVTMTNQVVSPQPKLSSPPAPQKRRWRPQDLPQHKRRRLPESVRNAWDLMYAPTSIGAPKKLTED